MAGQVLLFEPQELVFRDVQFSAIYSQPLRITNSLKGSVDITVKSGSPERYTVSPTSLRLKAGESALLDVRLRVLRFAQRDKAVQQGHRDIFHVRVSMGSMGWRGPQRAADCVNLYSLHAPAQGSFFEQKFNSTFFLAPDAVEPTTKSLPPGLQQKAKTSPRDR